MSKEPWLYARATAALQRAEELREVSKRYRAEAVALCSGATDVRATSKGLPRCPTCGHDETKPALRTDLVQYFRCPRCGFVWSRRHPDTDSATRTA